MPKPTKNPGKIKFPAMIKQSEEFNASGYIEFPYDLKELYGIGNLVPVNVTFDGIEYRGSIAKMGPKPLLLIRKDIFVKLNKQKGDMIVVTVEVDDQPRTVTIPTDLQKEFKQNIEVSKIFKSLTYSHQREYIDWYNDAKQDETRKRRLTKIIEDLHKKTK